MILGVLAVIAIGGTSVLMPGGEGLPSVTLPTSPTTTAPIDRAAGPTTAIGLARHAACLADYQAVLAADEAMFTSTGFFTDTIAQLVSAGYLHSAPSRARGYTIGLAYAPAGQGHGRDHGAGNGGRDPTGDATVNGVVGPAGCDGV